MQISLLIRILIKLIYMHLQFKSKIVLSTLFNSNYFIVKFIYPNKEVFFK